MVFNFPKNILEELDETNSVDEVIELYDHSFPTTFFYFLEEQFNVSK